MTDLTLEAAFAFCIWLSTWEQSSLASQSDDATGMAYFYRLPTRLEAEEFPATSSERLTCWTPGCRNLGGRGLRLVKQHIAPAYYGLYQYLLARDWQKADGATVDIVLKAAKAEKTRELDARTIATLPDSCLQALDHLWHCSRFFHCG